MNFTSFPPMYGFPHNYYLWLKTQVQERVKMVRTLKEHYIPAIPIFWAWDQQTQFGWVTGSYLPGHNVFLARKRSF